MLVWLCLLTSLGYGAPIESLDRILEQPIAARVSRLRHRGRAEYAGLAKIAFDRGQSLRARWRAVTTMGRLDPKYFADALARAAGDREWFMRNAALVAALSDQPARARAMSLKGLDDPALVVRTQAVRNLIHLDAREAGPRLWRELDAPRNFAAGKRSLWIRAHIAEALARFAAPGHARDFGRLLLDPDRRLHRFAIRGLESSSGMRLTAPGEAPEVARQRWLARLGYSDI